MEGNELDGVSPLIVVSVLGEGGRGGRDKERGWEVERERKRERERERLVSVTV